MVFKKFSLDFKQIAQIDFYIKTNINIYKYCFALTWVNLVALSKVNDVGSNIGLLSNLRKSIQIQIKKILFKLHFLIECK